MTYNLIIFILVILNFYEKVESRNNSVAFTKSELVYDEPSSPESKDSTVQFLWREMNYDTELKDSLSAIVINEEFLRIMTDAEKAALGYVSTFIGNECWWDGEANEDRGNLDCKIITKLDLGYQCSEKHIGFLREWFKNDNQVLLELEESNCPTTPYTASIQTMFDEIQIVSKDDSIIVFYTAAGMNVREQKGWTWSETVHFNLKDGALKLVNKKKTTVKHD